MNIITKRSRPRLKTFMSSLVVIGLLAGILYAHGDPIMGTVTAVTGDALTIKDKDGKTVVIMMEKATVFLKNDKPATKADLLVGARVIIDAHMEPKVKKLFAEEVNIGVVVAGKPEVKK